jgi:hypothetical protein
MIILVIIAYLVLEQNVKNMVATGNFDWVYVFVPTLFIYLVSRGKD